MKPCEKVLITLKHEEPDRIPIDFGSPPGITGINVFAYAKLKKYLGLPRKSIKLAGLGIEAIIEKEILEHFHVDMIHYGRPIEPCAPIIMELSKFTSLKLYDDNITIEIPGNIKIVEKEDRYLAIVDNEVVVEMKKDRKYFKSRRPLANANSIDDIKKFDWNRYRIPDNVIEIVKKAVDYNTDYAIVLTPQEVLMVFTILVVKILEVRINSYVDIKLRKSLAKAILDHIMDAYRY